MKARHLLPVFLLLPVLLFACVCIYFSQLSYLVAIKKAVTMLHNPDLASILPNAISPKYFAMLQQGSVACAIVLFSVGVFIILNWMHVQQQIFYYFRILWMDVKNIFSFHHLSKTEQNIFLVCIICFSGFCLYWMHQWDLQFDECWTYNYFINNNILCSTVTPYNNHYLYTAVSWWFNLILPVKLAIRLPAFLAGLCSIFIYAKFLATYKKSILFNVGIILFSTNLPLINYSISGRGYSFTVLFCAIGLLCLQKILQHPSRRKFYYYLGISQALGMYSCFTYFYPFVGFVLYLLFIIFLRTEYRKNYGIALLISCVGAVVLLAVPLILLKGLTPMLVAAAPSQYALQVVQPVLHGAEIVAYYFTSWHNGGVLYIVILLIASWLSCKYFNAIIAFCIMQCIIPFVFFIIQQNILFERIFTYLPVFVVVLVSFGMYVITTLFKNLQPKLAYVLLLFIPCAFFHFNRHYLFHWSDRLDIITHKTADYLLANNIDTCYTFYIYPVPQIQLRYQQQHKNIYFQKADIRSKGYAPFDSTKKYKCILSAVENNRNVAQYRCTTIDTCIQIWQ
jgi:hypothetical protein